jgi:hypothetical protein
VPSAADRLVCVDVAQAGGNTLKAANLIRRFVMKAWCCAADGAVPARPGWLHRARLQAQILAVQPGTFGPLYAIFHANTSLTSSWSRPSHGRGRLDGRAYIDLIPGEAERGGL